MKCTIVGCDHEVMYSARQICQMHYFRWMRNGTYELKNRNHGKRNTMNRSKHSGGYITVRNPDHPLASKNGLVYEHRKVLYDHLNGECPDCDICGKETSWEVYKFHVDHIDENKSNNAIDNLRLVCNSCNVTRTKKNYCSYDHVHAIEHDGEVKTAVEWSVDGRVEVSASCIRQRKLRGMSDYDCLFSPKMTHNGN